MGMLTDAHKSNHLVLVGQFRISEISEKFLNFARAELLARAHALIKEFCACNQDFCASRRMDVAMIFGRGVQNFCDRSVL